MSNEELDKLKRDIKQLKPEINEFPFGKEKNVYDRTLDLIEEYRELKFRIEGLEK